MLTSDPTGTVASRLAITTVLREQHKTSLPLIYTHPLSTPAMNPLNISIPPAYASRLRVVRPKDTRSDADIIASLTQHVSVTSEKNIWTYWHAGVQAMPRWCQRNIIGWVRLHGPSWTIRVLDCVPGSPNHALKWISGDVLPEAFVQGTMTGP